MKSNLLVFFELDGKYKISLSPKTVSKSFKKYAAFSLFSKINNKFLLIFLKIFANLKLIPEPVKPSTRRLLNPFKINFSKVFCEDNFEKDSIRDLI